MIGTVTKELRDDVKLYSPMIIACVAYLYSADWLYSAGYMNEAVYLAVSGIGIAAGIGLVVIIIFVFILPPLKGQFNRLEGDS